MLTSGIRKTGYILSGTFAAGTLLNVGYVIAGSPVWRTAAAFAAICLAMAVLLFLSARVEKLVWVQPLVFVVGACLAIMDDYRGFYGLGFFCLGILLLFRLGFFRAKMALKAGIALLFLYILEIASAINAGKTIIAASFPVFFMSIFLVLLYFSYEEKLMVYLKEPKPRLSLADKGFTPLETAYVFAIIEGKSAKEIAYEMKVTESTARNNISRAFHKLGLSDRHEFTILSMKHEIVA